VRKEKDVSRCKNISIIQASNAKQVRMLYEDSKLNKPKLNVHQFSTAVQPVRNKDQVETENQAVENVEMELKTDDERFRKRPTHFGP
jgi:hypothetical protein